MFIQETWAPNAYIQNMIPPSEVMNTFRPNKGGGSMIWMRKIPFQIHRCIPINQDMNLYRILLGRDKFIWVSSIYLSKGSFPQVQALFNKIYMNIPPWEWKYLLLPGDFNINLKA